MSQLIDISPGNLDSSLWFIQPGILDDVLSYGAFQVAIVVKNPPANARDIRDIGLIPGSGRSSGLGNGNPLQYYCLENPMGRGAWCATQSMGSQRVGHNWSDLAWTQSQQGMEPHGWVCRRTMLYMPPCTMWMYHNVSQLKLVTSFIVHMEQQTGSK